MNNPSAFRFYPREWLTSPAVLSLSLREEALYLRLACHCWLEGNIPNDVSKCAQIIGKGVTKKSIENVLPYFDNDPDNDGFLICQELEGDREKQRAWREKSRQGGLASKKARDERQEELIKLTAEEPKPKKKPPKKPPREYEPEVINLTEHLIETVQEKTSTVVNGHKRAQWLDIMRRVHDLDKIEYSRIGDALIALRSNYGEPYWPIIMSAKTFRDKFVNLERAMAKANEPYK